MRANADVRRLLSARDDRSEFGSGGQAEARRAVTAPDGTRIVCGAGNIFGNRDGRYRAETEFLEFSASTGSVTRILGHWTIAKVGAMNVFVLWSNASGSVLIGIIPDAGFGRVGVIRGTEFTPLRTSSVTNDDTW